MNLSLLSIFLITCTEFNHIRNKYYTAKTVKELFSDTSSDKIINFRGWSGGAMVLGKLPVPGRPTIWITVGQGPSALVVGAGGSCLDVFTLIYPFLFSFSLSLGDGPI